jgi:hypothetical protein
MKNNRSGNQTRNHRQLIVRGATFLVLFLSLVGGCVMPAQAQGPDDEALAAVLVGDAFVAPPPTGLQSQDGSLTPGYNQTSEFFIGRVAVGIVLPESNGSHDPSTENWTQAERSLVWDKVTAATNWWAAREPQAHLTFIYDDGTAAPTATGYEPINHPQRDQGLWIAEVMSNKGYSGSNYFDQVRQYNNALRQTHQTDWAFTIFVVDSSNDADGRFAGGPDSLFAYAYLNGPFTVATYDNASYGAHNMDAVVAHEVGHIFGALDQYQAAGVPCTQSGGYLGVENQNSQLGDCTSNVPSIMLGGVSPYRAASIDPYARGQVGWRDTDGDGILDPLDTPMTLIGPDQSALSQQENVFAFSGQLQQSSYPYSARSSVLINVFSRVQYRATAGQWVGQWIDVQATDGTFDSLAETFTFTTTPLPGGTVTVETQVIDSFGNQLLVQPMATLDLPGEPPKVNHTIFLPVITSQQ